MAKRPLTDLKAHGAYDDAGRGLLVMNVRDDADFLSPYSPNDGETLSADVAEFLTESAMPYPPRTPLALHIHSSCIDASEQALYRSAIRNYFSLRYRENKRDIRRATLQAAIMLLVGIGGLAGMFLAERLGVRALWIECIDIFAWVFLWEAVDQFFIERGRLSLRRQRLEAFLRMEVTYHASSACRDR